MINLKCDCCKFEKQFKSANKAFETGWDCPPFFTGYVSCNLCPGSYIVMGITDVHTVIHEKWEKEGRPVEFEVVTTIL